jgi:hypothetical protein
MPQFPTTSHKRRLVLDGTVLDSSCVIVSFRTRSEDLASGCGELVAQLDKHPIRARRGFVAHIHGSVLTFQLVS